MTFDTKAARDLVDCDPNLHPDEWAHAELIRACNEIDRLRSLLREACDIGLNATAESDTYRTRERSRLRAIRTEAGE
jgi:hypothetical protein